MNLLILNMNEYDVMSIPESEKKWQVFGWADHIRTAEQPLLQGSSQSFQPTQPRTGRRWWWTFDLNTLSILCQYSVTSATCDQDFPSLAGDVQQAVEHVVCHDQSDYHLWACGCTWTGYGVQLQSVSKIFTGIKKNTSTHPRVPQKENVPLHIDIGFLSQ